MLINTRRRRTYTEAGSRALTQVVYDPFTAANGTPIIGRVPPITVGGAAWYAGLGTMSILSNKCRSDNSSRVQIETGAADAIVKAVFNPNGFTGAGTMGLIFRYTDASYYWSATLTMSSRVFGIYERNVTSITRASITLPSIDPNVDYTFIATFNGSSIAAQIVELGVNLSYSSSFNADKSAHGLRAPAANILMDNFEVLV